MEEINLIRNLEQISSRFPKRLLKLQGYLLRNKSEESLELIIFKGFSSSSTHKIEIDLEKEVIEFDHYFKKFTLYKAPLKIGSEEIIRENDNFLFFLNPKNWI